VLLLLEYSRARDCIVSMRPPLLLRLPLNGYEYGRKFKETLPFTICLHLPGSANYGGILSTSSTYASGKEVVCEDDGIDGCLIHIIIAADLKELFNLQPELIAASVRRSEILLSL